MRRIPKSFQLGPHTITVEVLPQDQLDDVLRENGMANAVGLTVYETNTIYILKASKKFAKTSQLHTFWHEYFHMLFHHVGRDRLSRDEGLVDVCGALHLQMLQTAQF